MKYSQKHYGEGKLGFFYITKDSWKCNGETFMIFMACNIPRKSWREISLERLWEGKQ